MTQRPPRQPPPTQRPPAGGLGARPEARPAQPSLETYRPSTDRPPGQGQAGAPPFEQRYSRPQQDFPQVARARRAGAPAGRRKRSWLRTMAWALGGLGVLVAASIAALVLFAPVGLIRDQLVREVKARTGRELVITGRTSLSVYPSLGVSMGEVSLSSPAGMGGAPLVRMRRLEASVKTMPLLRRQIEIERVVLTDPTFELRVDARGRRSWDFAGLATTPHIQIAQATPPSKQGSGGLPAELSDFLRNATPGAAPTAPRAKSQAINDISFGDVRIDNGTIRYRDERSGATEEVKSINARVSGKSIATPIDAKGNLALRGDTIEFDGRLASPKAILEERPTRVVLALSSPRASGRYDGSLNLAQGPQLDGALKLETGSVRGLAAWAGMALPPSSGLGPLALKADLKSGPTWIALSNTDAKLDDTSATGSLNVDVVGGRPTIKANLRFGVIDLNKYLPPAAGPGSESKGSGQAAAAKAPALPRGATPQVKGFEQRSGWSNEPLDLASLALFDADAKLTFAGMLIKEIKVGNTQLTVTVKNRVAKATIEDFRLYEGQGRGIVSLDGSLKVPGLGVNLALDGVSGLPLLKDAAGFDWIAGKARVQIAVAGAGISQGATMENLAGKSEFTFLDGAIVGINVPQMIRGVSQGRFSGFNRTTAEKTDFSEAGASFQIKGGVAETKDIRLASPLIRMTGAGHVDLGKRQIDITMRPKIVGSLAGQGAAGDLSGLELPVKVKGPWEKPQIGPDVQGLLKDPGKAVEALKEIGRQLQGKDATVDQLLGRFLKK